MVAEVRKGVVDERAVAKAEAAKEAGLEGAGMAAAMEVAGWVGATVEVAKEEVTGAVVMAAVRVEVGKVVG